MAIHQSDSSTSSEQNLPLVSIVVIFLDAADFIEEAIESVFAQTYPSWELILVDDGSTDASSSIATRYAERHLDRVTYVEHPAHENRGMSASRNLGIRSSKGELIAFLDADDVWFPYKLEEQVTLLNKHPEAGMVYGVAMYWLSWSDSWSNNEDYVVRSVAHLGDVAPPPSLTLDSYPLGRGAAPCPSDLLLRRGVIDAVGGFEASFRGPLQLYEDQAFLAKVYLATPIFVADRVWIRYRQHPNSCVSVVRSSGRSAEVRLYFLKWFETYLRENDYRDHRVWRALSQAMWLENHPNVKRWKEKLLRRQGPQIMKLG